MGLGSEEEAKHRPDGAEMEVQAWWLIPSTVCTSCDREVAAHRYSTAQYRVL